MERIDALVRNLPAGVWTEAAARSSTLGWFLTEDAYAAQPAARIALALANALPQDLAEPAPALAAKVSPAMERAKALRFASEDGQFVFAACTVIYGPGFDTRTAWAKDALNPAYTPELHAALLRARIAIDTAAWL